MLNVMRVVARMAACQTESVKLAKMHNESEQLAQWKSKISKKGRGSEWKCEINRKIKAWS